MECNKYQDGLIYTIKTDNGLYVGSTCDFVARKYKHKSNCFNENGKLYNTKLYQNIRENGGEYSIELYKLFPCNSDEELRIEEEQVRKYLNPNLNTYKCIRTKEEKKEYNKEWIESNKQHRQEYRQKWSNENKDKKRNYDETYRKKNKEKITIHKKEKYQQNKEDVKKKQAEIITCECGCETTRGHISRHRKSKKHLNLMDLPECV